MTEFARTETRDLLRQSRSRLDFGDVGLDVLTAHGMPSDFEHRADSFFMAKSLPYIEGYLEITEGRRFSGVLEIGLYKGGSMVFFDRLLEPKALSIVELEADVQPHVSDYAATKSKARIKVHNGVNQADKDKLREIVRSDFPDGLDLVIDDASHWYEPSKASFEAIFPLMQPGGIYVVEDWGWGHSTMSCGTEKDGTRLLHDVIGLHAARADIVPTVCARAGFFWLKRGSTPLPDEFRFEEYLVR